MVNKKRKNIFNKAGKDPGAYPTSSKKKSYFEAYKRTRNRKLMIILPAVTVLVVLVAYSLSVYSVNIQYSSNSFSYGVLGSAHEHAAFAARLNGTQFDFGTPQYQVKSKYMHVENEDGTTLHRHATKVPIYEFFKTIKMNLTNNCFTTDKGVKYCSNEKNNLEFYVNGSKVSSISDYVFNDGDRILIVYGDTPLQVKQDQDQLRQQVVKK